MATTQFLRVAPSFHQHNLPQLIQSAGLIRANSAAGIIVKLYHDGIVHQFHNKKVSQLADTATPARRPAALQSGRVFNRILTVHAGHYCEHLSRRSRAKISQ